MYKFLVSILFTFLKDPESVHHLALLYLRFLGLPPFNAIARAINTVRSPLLVQEVFGIRFNNPVGIAAGFDKEGKVILGLEALGFGYVEVGTVTKYPQRGNPRQRVFRFDNERAVINRMGFNNRGADAMVKSLVGRRAGMPVGVSLGKSKLVELEDAPMDYRYSFSELYNQGDYFVVNVSSPNTPGLRELQDKKHLLAILSSLNEFRNAQAAKKPLLVKIAPDLSYEAIDEVLEVCRAERIDGIIAVNTSVGRRGVSKEAASIAGGLSGEPIQKMATDIIRYIHKKSPGMTIIGVGGIFSAEDAYEKIKAGATLVQVYTGFIYEGPGIAGKINRGLVELLKKDGYASISDAVGKG